MNNDEVVLYSLPNTQWSISMVKNGPIWGIKLPSRPREGSVILWLVNRHTKLGAYYFQDHPSHGPVLWVPYLQEGADWKLTYIKERWEDHFRRTHGADSP